MHNFLFGNKSTSYSSFSPFGSSNNTKPGIITKIKNKISDLFQPQVNPSSVVQRIQQDSIQEQELNLQFQTNFLLVDHINSSKQGQVKEKRKILYPFDKYLQDEIEKEQQNSKESQTDVSYGQEEGDPKKQKSKRFIKFKKNHAKIEKSRKMEGNIYIHDFVENSQQLQFLIKPNSIIVKNSTQNLDNSMEQISQKSQKSEIHDYTCSESIIPMKCVHLETNETSLQQDFQSNNFIQSNDYFDHNSLTFQKKQQDYSKQENDCQDNLIKTNSTSSNTKEEGQSSSYFALNMEDLRFPQEDEVSEKTSSNSVEITNQLYSFFNLTHEMESKFNLLLQNENIDNEKQLSEKQKLSSIKKIDKSLQEDLQQDSDTQKVQFVEVNESTEKTSQDACHTQLYCQTARKDELPIIDKQVNTNSIQQEQDLQPQSLVIKQFEQQQKQPSCFVMQETKKEQSSLNFPSTSCQKTFAPTQFVSQIDQTKLQSQKAEQQLKENNPFLESSTRISQDQITQYFQTGLQCQKSTHQQNSTNSIDLFKITNNTQLFNLNYQQQGNLNQNQPQFKPLQDNTKMLTYSTNKQMEIIEQLPEPQKTFFNTYQIQPQSQIQLNNQFYPQHCIQQQQQQMKQMPQQSQQLQQSLNPPWMNQPVNLQYQNLFSQNQSQTQYQQSSLNLFSSPSNPYLVGCQQGINSKGSLNTSYQKSDVLNLFQDPQKLERGKHQSQVLDLFSADMYPQSGQTQSLNNSFNKGNRKKQRINNI